MPTRQFDVQVDDGAAVTVLRAAIAQELSKETNQLVLIFGGKILKDEDTLTQHAIKDGHSVHLVVKNKKEVFLIQFLNALFNLTSQRRQKTSQLRRQPTQQRHRQHQPAPPVPPRRQPQ